MDNNPGSLSGHPLGAPEKIPFELCLIVCVFFLFSIALGRKRRRIISYIQYMTMMCCNLA